MISTVSSRILDKLSPMVGEGEGKLRQVEQLPIVNAANEQALADILESYRSRMPGGILSVPQLQFTNGEGGPRLTDVDLGFALVIGYQKRDKFPDRIAFHLDRFEEVAQYLRLVTISRAGMQTTNRIDFLRFTAWEYGETEDVTAQIWTFNIKVRNWQPNELES